MKFRFLFTSLILFSVCAFGQGTLTTEQIYQEAYENFVKRDYTNASASLDKINPVDQKKPDILNLRGAIYKRLGELDNAANAYSDALKVNPKDWVPKYNLAEVNFLREQYKASRTFLEQALASMPEADRLQKQDLILYKVYLTYLLQGEEEKAKLLLDSFDINSSNPVYYFAQAAWSYKKKDAEKAKTWVDSTDGLYSQDLRNSYSQSLVDVGWLEPLAGVAGVTVAASPVPSPTTEMVMAEATPVAVVPTAVPAGETSAEIVPLSTNNATPIKVVENSPTVTTPEANPSTSPAITPSTVATGKENAEPAKTDFWKILLPVVLVLGLAAIILINLAKRSRMVPAPVDNTGYAAIAASSNPDETDLSSHKSEGTGVVRVQEPEEIAVAAPIKVMPIHREYAADQEAAAEKEAAAAKAPSSGRTTRRIQTSATTPSRKSDSKSQPAARKTKTASTQAGKAPASKSGKSSSTKTAPVAGANSTRTTAATVGLPATDSALSADLAVPATVSPKTAGKKATPSKKAPATAAKTGEGSSSPKRTRLIPIPTIDVPLAEEAKKTRVLVSNIGKIVVPAGGQPQELASSDPATEPSVSAGKVSAARKSSSAKKPAAAKTAPSAARSEDSTLKPQKAVAPLISIPEFEEAEMEPQTRTVLRVVPNQPDESGDPVPRV